MHQSLTFDRGNSHAAMPEGAGFPDMHQAAERQQRAQVRADAAQRRCADDPALRHCLLLACRGALEIDPACLRIFNSHRARRIDQSLIIDIPPTAAVERRQCIDPPARCTDERRKVEGAQHFSPLTKTKRRVQNQAQVSGKRPNIRRNRRLINERQAIRPLQHLTVLVDDRAGRLPGAQGFDPFQPEGRDRALTPSHQGARN